MTNAVNWTSDFRAPLDAQVSDIFIDESGSKASRSKLFVLGMVKCRDTAMVARALRYVRERHKFFQEIHFADVTRDSAPVFIDAMETLAQCDVRIGAYVFDKRHIDPFSYDLPPWQIQGLAAARLVRGNINRGELVSVFLDLVTTPKENSMASFVKQSVNSVFKSTSVVSSLDLDSKSHDLLQMADLVASSVAYQRYQVHASQTLTSSAPSLKGQLARRLQRCFDLDSFDDIREGRVNILTAGVENYQPSLL
ncbi:DUF3800 domain-containing protein [Trueperella pyogenes]|uniref:DUF3800 domain-containing protein n=1 Tax=Trueperella pyogenes TaxID=1661 RepID=UPI00215C7551|nr:DUF3800 domain-containing protein [Trueperella pyogenes]UVJ59034.1 DUF3800 domain-containing protein [Trueperella pyogenes]